MPIRCIFVHILTFLKLKWVLNSMIYNSEKEKVTQEKKLTDECINKIQV